MIWLKTALEFMSAVFFAISRLYFGMSGQITVFAHFAPKKEKLASLQIGVKRKNLSICNLNYLGYNAGAAEVSFEDMPH